MCQGEGEWRALLQGLRLGLLKPRGTKTQGEGWVGARGLSGVVAEHWTGSPGAQVQALLQGPAIRGDSFLSGLWILRGGVDSLRSFKKLLGSRFPQWFSSQGASQVDEW